MLDKSSDAASGHVRTLCGAARVLAENNVMTSHSWLRLAGALLIAALAHSQASAQQPAALTHAAAKRLYEQEKARLTKTAEAMPAEHYAFKLTSDSKPFAANLAAVTSLGARVCGELTGRTNAMASQDLQATLKSKTDVAPALAQSFAVCDSYFDALPSSTARVSATVESLLDHYTSMADFLAGHLRAKGIEPPR